MEKVIHIYIYIYIYDCCQVFFDVSVTLFGPFRQRFRKPSGSFRDAGFKLVSCGAYLRACLQTRKSILTELLTGQLTESIHCSWGYLKWVAIWENACNLPESFRKPSGNLPGNLLTVYWKLSMSLDLPITTLVTSLTLIWLRYDMPVSLPATLPESFRKLPEPT